MSGQASRIGVAGAGAVGAIAARQLTAAGLAPVLLETDAAHRDAIEAGGLRLTGVVRETLRVRVAAWETLAGDPGQLDLLLLCLPAGAIPQAFEAARPHLAPDAAVIVLANGFAYEAVARNWPQRQVIATAFTFGGVRRAPGEILVARLGPVEAACTDGSPLAGLAERALRALGPLRTQASAAGLVWGKAMAVGAMAVASLTDMDAPEAFALPHATEAALAVAGEIRACAAAEGAAAQAGFGLPAAGDRAPPAAQAEAFVRWQRRFWEGTGFAPGDRRTGIWRAIAAGRTPTEAAVTLGEIIGRARRNGVPTPRLVRLLELLAQAEACGGLPAAALHRLPIQDHGEQPS